MQSTFEVEIHYPPSPDRWQNITGGLNSMLSMKTPQRFPGEIQRRVRVGIFFTEFLECQAMLA
jgi:hypothetical protein